MAKRHHIIAIEAMSTGDILTIKCVSDCVQFDTNPTDIAHQYYYQHIFLYADSLRYVLLLSQLRSTLIVS